MARAVPAPLSPPRPPTLQQDGAMSMGGWTPSHEARLVYVQGRLREAQKRWSEDQGEWIDEVHSLEDLKRRCLKAEKKLQSAEQRGGRGRKGSLAGLWRKRGGGGGAGTKTPTTTPSTTEAESPTAMLQKTGEEEEASVEGEGTEDDDEGPNGEPARRRLSTLLRRTISLSSNRGPSVSKNADTGSGGGRRNTYDFGTPARAVSAGEARVDGEGGGKGRLRRRRSGR
ncbi:MAG: hypothetical protein Q9202_003166 [Teloschistes flavicans]